MHFLFVRSLDIKCANFNKTEDVTMEDIVNGHRLSCRRDRSISWEVHCVNETWISETPKSCGISKKKIQYGKLTIVHGIVTFSMLKAYLKADAKQQIYPL